jgi:hypothetical protein
VGYFTNFMSIPYNVTITHPATFGKHFNDRLGYQHYGRYFITARYAELVENQSCIQNRITQHLQLTDGNPY